MVDVAPPKPRTGLKVQVHVTQEDIETALPKNSGHCMISDAIKRALPEATSIGTDLQTIRATLKDKGRRYIWLTPRVAQNGLVKFDAGIQPTPFSFVLKAAHTLALKKNKKGPKRLATISGRSNGIPEVRDGVAPPRSALASGRGRNATNGRNFRREFGIRALERPSEDNDAVTLRART